MNAGQHDFKILLVDDHQLSQKLLEKQLGILGFHNFSYAVNGQEGLAAMDAEHFDIVFFDWTMPVMDGLTFLKKCKERGSGRKTAYIMVSSEAQAQKILEIIQEGATSYLIKPVTLDDLKAKMGKVLEWLKK